MKFWQVLLLPFSWLYGMCVRCRHWCYDVSIFKTTTLNVPVISVGNMTTGGTGKTPMVEYLVRYFERQQKNVAVVSRGYKRKTHGTVIISAEQEYRGSAEIIGDEPYQIASKFPKTTVVVDKKRVRGAKLAQQNAAEIIILDDGFQHRALGRNFDIVMLDGTRSLDKIPMLPAGVRRETLSSLKRAHLIAHSSKINASIASFPQIPHVIFEYELVCLRRFYDRQSVSIESMIGLTAIAFCGIGNPLSFQETLNQNGIEILDCIVFPDHHWYRKSDIEKILDRYNNRGADIIITTEKDSVRLTKEIMLPQVLEKLYILEIRLRIIEGETQYLSLLDKAVSRSE